MVADENGMLSIAVPGVEENDLKAAATTAGIGYYGLCTIGGILSAGTTHLLITPLDVLKVNMQLNPIKYNSIHTCFTTLLREQGPSTFWRGWASKSCGYALQGGCRFGLYEYFKTLYSSIIPDDYQQNRNLIFFTSSATAEVFANLCLCPFEAIKVKVQAQHHFAKGLLDGFPRLYASSGIHGYVSMVMFTTFEHTVDLLYRKVIHASKEDCSKAGQLGITFMAGYAAGSVGSLISNPADNLVTHLYNNKADGLIMAVKKIGCVNLFTRSLPIRVILVGPAVTLQWLLFDTIKVMSGLPTSGEVRSDLTLHEQVSDKICSPRN
ncbi:Mitochondrial phosphate carrier protein 1, mitochondrial [Linum perenne]